MYRCPAAFDDGLPITFRTESDGSQELIRAIHAVQPETERYDIVFVDPWHTYRAGIADLHGALCLLRPGGIIVVHDCNPDDPAIVTPEFKEGAWCGVTYQAFINFALSAGCAGYCVINSDYGVGVLFGPGTEPPPTLPTARPPQRTVFEWVLAQDRDEHRFALFERNRDALLNLVSSEHFRAALGAPERLRLEYAPELPPAPAEPDVNMVILADGVECKLMQYENGWHRFTVPAEAADVSLLSPTFSPAETDGGPDARRLGVAVVAIRAGSDMAVHGIGLADPVLSGGWHSEEAAAGYPWRWTDGQARLSLPPGTTVLEVFTANRA